MNADFVAPQSPFPPATWTRLLGVDYGSVRIGLAITDPDRIIASPLDTYERRTTDIDGVFFQRLISAERIARIVLGLPIHNDGREGIKAREVRVFGNWLEQTTHVPVVYWDERFTTVEAEAALWEAGLTHRKRKQRRDRVAAQLLLQGYLDAGCPASPIPSAEDQPESNIGPHPATNLNEGILSDTSNNG